MSYFRASETIGCDLRVFDDINGFIEFYEEVFEGFARMGFAEQFG